MRPTDWVISCSVARTPKWVWDPWGKTTRSYLAAVVWCPWQLGFRLPSALSRSPCCAPEPVAPRRSSNNPLLLIVQCASTSVRVWCVLQTRLKARPSHKHVSARHAGTRSMQPRQAALADSQRRHRPTASPIDCLPFDTPTSRRRNFVRNPVEFSPAPTDRQRLC